MADRLVELGKNPSARKVIGTLGLPIPLPQDLSRGEGPWTERPLEEHTVIVGDGPGAVLHDAIAHALAPAGAGVRTMVHGEAPYAQVAEAFSRAIEVLPLDHEPAEHAKAQALVFDATGLVGPQDLSHLHHFFHAWIRKLDRCGRVVVLGRPAEDQADPAASAAAAALNGFVKSLAKEIGNRGSTANRITVPEGADPGPALRWLLSERSAFVTGQTLALRKGKVSAVWTRPLEGKVALVTGAARGIGAATARRLAEEGAKVVCLDRPDDADKLSMVAQTVGGVVLLMDVTEEGAAERVAEALGQLGGVDIVVHNAGVTRDKTLAKMDDDRWNLTLDVNLSAILRITDALTAGKSPVLNKGGRIVCLSSIAGIAGNFGQTNYAASKAGLIGWVEHMSRSLNRRQITVNAVAPGFVETRLTEAIPLFTREGARRLAALGQGGQPVDIAEAITFFATPGAQGLNGQVLRVCGGSFVGA